MQPVYTETEADSITEDNLMKITAQSEELTKQEQYFLTKAQDIMKMSDAVGQTMELESWCIYEDTNSDGKDVELFSLRNTDGEAYATNSGTFIAAFRDILDVFEPGEIKKLKIMSGTSKNGRTYITCAYAD